MFEPANGDMTLQEKSSDSIDLTIEHIFFDHIVPRILDYAGELVLHAGLIEAQKIGLVVSGASGRGKSTLTASLCNANYVLHGDDALVVRKGGSRFLARSVYRSLRVLPDTLERLLPAGANVRRIANYSQKLRVILPPEEAQPLPPVPLAALLFLASPPPNNRVTLRRMRPAEACMALIENSFALDPSDRERARDKLHMASALAIAVPAFELSYPRDYGRLDDVRRALVEGGILPPADVADVTFTGTDGLTHRASSRVST